MKRLISILTLTALVMTSMLGIVATADNSTTGMVLYVATNGDDNAQGTEDAPLATLEGARNKIREIKKSGFPENGITVMFRGGEYAWKNTVEFTEEDSGTANGKIVYCSYPGEEACFTGGARIPASEFSKVTDENILAKWSNRKAKDAIRQINIKDFMAKRGYTNIEDYYPITGDIYTQGADEYIGKRPIYSTDDDPALWLARYPNKVDGNYEENPVTKYLTIGNVEKTTSSKKGDTEGSVFHYDDRRISKYAGYEDVWLYGLIWNIFFHTEIRVSQIDPANTTITTAVPPTSGFKAGREFFLFNILDELDQPGEYYVDKNSGILYFYPTNENFQYFNVGVFNGESMIKTDGASHITFSGISFENTRGNAIYFRGGDSCRVEYCTIKNIGGNAVRLGNRKEVTYTHWVSYNWKDWTENDALNPAQTATKAIKVWSEYNRSVAYRGKNHGVYGCKIKNTGVAGIEISGGNAYTNEESGYYVENCDISFVGQNKRTYEAAVTYMAHGMTIKNNTISHIPGTAINGYMTKAEIIGNEIFDVLTESQDMGVIYTNYTCMGLDIKINNNYFHDVLPEHDITSPTTTISQRSTIAFDNQYTNGCEIKNNVIKNIPRGAFLNDMHEVENNVFIDCYEPVCTRNATDHFYPIKEGTEAFTPDNILGGGSEHSGFTYCWPIFADEGYGEKYTALWNEQYPKVMKWIEIIKSQKHEGKLFYKIKNNLIVNKDQFLYANHVRMDDVVLAQNVGVSEQGNNNYISDTSVFVDWTNGNYQLTPDAAKKYGLNVIDMSKIGVQITPGVEGYKAVMTSVPTVSGGTTAPSASVDTTKVKDAVVLKIGSSNALNKGTAAKVDTQNDAVMPKIIDSRTLVPARFIAESFGGEVGWDDATRTVTIKLNGKTVTMVLDKNELMIDGEVVATMDVPAQSIEGRTMVPLRALCETALSKTVFWDPMGLIVISDGDILDNTADAAYIKSIYDSLK